MISLPRTFDREDDLQDLGFLPPAESSKSCSSVDNARARLESATKMRCFHWAIVLLSAMLSLVAWRYAESVLADQMKTRYERETAQATELLKERMHKYEDALWSGVALMNSVGADLSRDQWNDYASSIHIDRKYPGINGIGVIHSVRKSDVDRYLATQQTTRPDFSIFPKHEGEELFPISYIVPVRGNEQAVGLDMAHEKNRLQAVRQSRDSGNATMTAPITLVQDSKKTPGFLLFAPYYDSKALVGPQSRRDHFSGLVYAPFVVHRLMRGTLEKEKRHIGIRLYDGDTIIYDENQASGQDYDATPLFTSSTELEMYGRKWHLDFRSTKSFRDAVSTSQPIFILIGGVLIDGLLILLFLSVTKSSRMALAYADSMTHQIKVQSEDLRRSQALTAQRAQQLEQSNAELEQFACVASHDLQEPLRKVTSYCELLADEYGAKLGEEGRQYANFAIDGANRMRTLIRDLLAYSKISSMAPCEESLPLIESSQCVAIAIKNLESAIEDSGAIITVGNLPKLSIGSFHLTQLFQNLIGNAIKYRTEDAPEVYIRAENQHGRWVFSVSDNGIGIRSEYHDRIFGIFKRLHNRETYAGTGIGLAVCKKVVERYNGSIWVDPHYTNGSRFCFSIECDQSNDMKKNSPTHYALS